MVCPQTTHCAILLSLLGRRESVTEYSAPQWGQKKVPPSGTGPNRGTSAPPYTPNQYAPRREQIPAPSSPPRANPRSSSPVMMRSLTWSYPQKSPYSFDTAPAAAHRPRRVNTHSTKLQLLAHVHKRQKIPRSLLVCRHQNSTTRHHPARRRRSRPPPRTTSGAAAAGYREVLRRLVASAGVIHVPRLWWVE
jgi:hypothetical protein